jgi:hypothetical protein
MGSAMIDSAQAAGGVSFVITQNFFTNGASEVHRTGSPDGRQTTAYAEVPDSPRSNTGTASCCAS